jgi:hypothetical protein
LRRVVKRRSSVMKRRAAVFARIDALLELLGPGWYEELGTDYGNASLHLLARYANPHDLVRLGPSRLARFLIRYSHGLWRQAKATALIQVARDALALWGEDGMDFAALAADVAVEADQALMFTAQVRALDVRIAALYREADPDQIVRTAPGVGPVLAAAIIGRLGDPHRFTSLSAIRSYSGLVPKVRQSGQAEHDGGITKAGDPMLREAAWMAADMARRADPQLAAKYVQAPPSRISMAPSRRLVARRAAILALHGTAQAEAPSEGTLDERQALWEQSELARAESEGDYAWLKLWRCGGSIRRSMLSSSRACRLSPASDSASGHRIW